VWGHSVDGADGVKNVMGILRSEFQAAMALCGRTSIGAIDKSVLW
jgi:4-hydroxymandelate oxidase